MSAQQQHDAASEEKTIARRPRRNHSPAFKAKVAVAAIKGEKTMIDPTAKLSVSRGAIYLKPPPMSDAELQLMHRIDKLHMEFRFAGRRMLQGLLIQEEFKVGRLHVATLMKRMGIEALYRQPNTSKPAPKHKIYPYLLTKLPITRPNKV